MITLPNLRIPPNQWVNLYERCTALCGVAVAPGKALNFQLLTDTELLICVSADKPGLNHGWRSIGYRETVENDTTDPGAWVYCQDEAWINIQPVGVVVTTFIVLPELELAPLILGSVRPGTPVVFDDAVFNTDSSAVLSYSWDLYNDDDTLFRHSTASYFTPTVDCVGKRIRLTQRSTVGGDYAEGASQLVMIKPAV